MRVLSACLLAFALLAGCSDDPLTDAASADLAVADARDGSKSYKGKPVRIGNGVARAYATVLPSGEPEAIGVQMTHGSMYGLPTTFSDQRAC